MLSNGCRRRCRQRMSGCADRRSGRGEQFASVWVVCAAAMPYPPTSPSISMHRSSIHNLLHAATFALPDGHPVVDALNRACSSGLAGDMVRAKDAIAALLNHDPKAAEQLAFA